ncbi:tcmK [Symbiodinium sp. CCMP2456]|nr:tcmK [Symbiodinium sp. CCMP2456]
MAACHVGIRKQAFGPTNTISLGDVSSLLAIGEAAAAIERGAADVMIAGGYVAAEGAAFFLLESRDHAERRGFAQRGGKAWGSVAAVSTRCEPSIDSRQPTGKAIVGAVQDALEKASVAPSDLAMVKAHGSARIETDAMEAAALAETIGDAPVTAPTSYLGSSGAAGGSLELALALVGWRQGVVPATLNYETPDPACPVNASAEHRPADGEAMLALNYALTGQAIAAVIERA